MVVCLSMTENVGLFKLRMWLILHKPPHTKCCNDVPLCKLTDSEISSIGVAVMLTLYDVQHLETPPKNQPALTFTGLGHRLDPTPYWCLLKNSSLSKLLGFSYSDGKGDTHSIVYRYFTNFIQNMELILDHFV